MCGFTVYMGSVNDVSEGNSDSTIRVNICLSFETTRGELESGMIVCVRIGQVGTQLHVSYVELRNINFYIHMN
jgi:hypothetical protein